MNNDTLNYIFMVIIGIELEEVNFSYSTCYACRNTMHTPERYR